MAVMEHWKPVPSRQGLMASSEGRVLLPEREAKMPHGGIRRYTPKPTHGVVSSAKKDASHKYMGVSTRFYGNIKVHQAVCEAFHGQKPFPGAVVIHLNEDGCDNRAENLRWGTQKENLNMPGFIKYCRGRTGENSPFVKGRK